MKKFLLLNLILLCLVNTTLKGQINDTLRYEHKMKVFTKMKNTGNTLTLVGIGTSVVGAALIGSFIIENDGKTTEELEFGSIMKMYGGAICLELGIDMIIGGVVLKTIAKHKIKSYQQKLQNVSYNIIFTPKIKGIGLTFRF